MNGFLILIVVISFSIAAFVRFFLNYIRKITFKIAQTEVILQVAKNGLRLTTVNGDNLFLQNQTIKRNKRGY